jgi:hypothetical protein
MNGLLEEVNEAFSRPAIDLPLHTNLKDNVGDELSSTDASYRVELSEYAVKVRPAQEHWSLYFIDQFDSAVTEDTEGFVRFLHEHYIAPDFTDIDRDDVYDFKLFAPRVLTAAVAIATLEHYEEYDGETTVRYIQ